MLLKAGVTVHEYKVLEKCDPALDREFDRITDEWLDGKKSGMLQFTMGTLVGLEDPMDKRYFYALNLMEKWLPFIVFVPFLGKTATWQMRDEARERRAQRSHGDDHIRGTCGIQGRRHRLWQSRCCSPLAGLSAESKKLMERLLQFYL